MASPYHSTPILPEVVNLVSVANEIVPVHFDRTFELCTVPMYGTGRV
jgi:hypothetical protein